MSQPFEASFPFVRAMLIDRLGMDAPVVPFASWPSLQTYHRCPGPLVKMVEMCELDHMKCQDKNTIQWPMQMTCQCTLNSYYTARAIKKETPKRSYFSDPESIETLENLFPLAKFHIPEVQSIRISKERAP